jgi:protein-disulfide isomerase
MNTRALLLWLSLSVLACANPAASPPSTALAAPVPTSPQAFDAGGVSPAQPAPSEESAAVPISPRNPTWGSRLAPVTIVEFAELQDPYTSKVWPTLTTLREIYGSEKLRIVWKNDPLPFHTNAQSAAEAAMGVFALSGADAFWRFHDLALENQQGLGRDAYLKWAELAGVRDTAAFAAGLDSHQWAFAVEQDTREGKTIDVKGTPTFFVNGVRVDGAQPFATFAKTIDEQLAKAQTEVAAGTPPERVYSKLAANARAAARLTEKNEKKADAAQEDREGIVHKVPLGKAPILGPPMALVTIVEFADFQCPFSARVQETLRSLRAEYGNKLRIVWRNHPLPFHKAAEAAAEAAMEVRAQKGEPAFWAMHDKLFADQKDLMKDDAPNVDYIADLASDAGANRDRVKTAIAKGTHRREIEADADLAEDFKMFGTPNFFINGRPFLGAQPKEKFEKIIDEEVTRAQALLDSGVKGADLYAKLTKDGVGIPEPDKKDVPGTLPKSAPTMGGANAKVVVHEWADFQCPFSARAAPTMQQLLKDYGGRVQLVWHDLPLPNHAHARDAAQAAREAFEQKGSLGFSAMHDKLFANQQHLTRADLDAYATELGLDMARWAAALDGNSHGADVDFDGKTAGDAGITGTPGFIVASAGASRGYFVSGAQSYHKFRRLIERALAEAK